MATIKNTINAARISVDMFYEKQKELYDICGNVINNEKYPFVDILSKYLTDIVGLIDIEIKNSARNSMINWREKKNPKLLSRLINNDDNVNLINMSMNKITSSNFMNIVNEISEALLNDNYRKLPDYCSFLFDVVIKKCMIDEAFSKDYIRFLFGFKDNIAKHLNENVKKFTEEAVGFLTSNKTLKEYSYFHYVKDVALWRNIGVIFANIYTSFTDNAGIGQINIVDNLEAQFDILFNILDWLPANMDELNGRLFMVFAIIESLSDDIWSKFSEKSRALFKEILTLVYNCANIPNKIKFKVLDLQDMIKNIKVSSMVASTVASTVAVEKNIVLDSIEPKKDNTLSNNPNPNPNPNPTPTPTPTPTQNPVNIWEARKQQQVTTNPIQKQLISTTTQSTQPNVPLFTTTNSSIPLYNVKELNNTNQRTNKNENNKEDYIQLGAGLSRNRRSSHGKGNSNYSRGSNINSNSNRKVEEEPKSKNMFSGLESGDSNDEHSNELLDKNRNKTNEQDDDFITVEKKSKNIYKPKKTPAIAVEGGKIYSNVSNASGKSNYSKRK
jgi:hypothetical protein